MKKIFHFGNSALFVLYIFGFVFTLSSSLPTYINSSFLGVRLGEHAVGYVYIVCSLLMLALFVYIPGFLKKYGNYKVSIALSIANILTLFGVAFFHNIIAFLASFIVTYSTATIISFCLDIFIEHNSDDADTGAIRSTYIMITNVAWLFVPWLSGLFVGVSSYAHVYFAAGCIMVPVICILTYNLKNFVDPSYVSFKFMDTVKEAAADRNIRSVFALNFLLQFFYAWMIIYTPIYLHQYIGFDWKTIGIMFTIMLTPFVFLQVPLGIIADKKWGEKEMLALGFIIMAISCVLIPLVGGKDFLIWTLLLFSTRIGAAIVGTMSDVYFFKKISDKDANLISLYRTTYPFAYILGPLAAAIFLLFFPLNDMFYALGLIMLFGLRYSLAIQDTK